MSFLIAAAGTGGHVFPGLAVGEALVSEGVRRGDILYVGGDRLESTVYPSNGFDFFGLELRGLKRSLAPSNLSLPAVILRARNRIGAEIETRQVRCVLGMGGYVTIPAAMAARKTQVPLMISEQNAGAGLANRIASRWAEYVFTSFPLTDGLESGDWVGNPVRSNLAHFDRSSLRPEALRHYELMDGIPTLGVFGGSLGAASINTAVATMIADWQGGPMQVVHLVGSANFDTMVDSPSSKDVVWKRYGFEEHMELFFAAADLVVARAGGAVAEITVTGTPSILVPGDFGSSGHQTANAAFLAEAGAAVVVPQADLVTLPHMVDGILADDVRLKSMRTASLTLARPDAARTIAQAMIATAG